MHSKGSSIAVEGLSVSTGLCSLLMPYWTGLCVLRRTCRQDYETFFYVVILSKHHHHYRKERGACKGLGS
jgi:hypothetical protein